MKKRVVLVEETLLLSGERTYLNGGSKGSYKSIFAQGQRICARLWQVLGTIYGKKKAQIKEEMEKLVARRPGKEAGFTLVELMVVVAVIAILAAIAMPQFLSAADKAKAAKVKADTQTIANAAQLYMVDTTSSTVPTVEELYKAGYLSEDVKTPKGGDYLISSESSGGSGNHIVVTAPDMPQTEAE